MSALAEQFRDAANLAVERALHRVNRSRYHERFPVGQCPLCDRVQNALTATRFHERIQTLLKDLGRQ